MLGFLTIFIGHFAYGITNALWKSPREKIGTFTLIAFRSLGCLIIFSIVFFISQYFGFVKFPPIDFVRFLKIFGICIINSFGLIFYVQSLKYGNATKVIGLGKLNIIIWILISFLIFQETISTKKIVFGLLITFGIYLIDSDRKQFGKIKPSKALLFTILSRVFWSTAFLFIPYIKELGILLFCIILELAVFTVSCMFSLFQKEKLMFLNFEIKTAKEILMLIILGAVGTLTLNFAIAELSILIFALLALMEPIVGLIFSSFYYNEKLQIRQLTGIAISLASSFILAL